MSEELLPCPFCGGEAEFMPIGDGDSLDWNVACKNCPVDFVSLAETKEETAAAWNRRDTSRIRAEVVEECARVVKEIASVLAAHGLQGASSGAFAAYCAIRALTKEGE